MTESCKCSIVSVINQVFVHFLLCNLCNLILHRWNVKGPLIYEHCVYINSCKMFLPKIWKTLICFMCQLSKYICTNFCTHFLTGVSYSYSICQKKRCLDILCYAFVKLLIGRFLNFRSWLHGDSFLAFIRLRCLT